MANNGQAVLRPSQVNVQSNLPDSAHSLSTNEDARQSLEGKIKRAPMSSVPCVSRTPTMKVVNLLFGHVVHCCSTKMARFLCAKDADNAKA